MLRLIAAAALALAATTPAMAQWTSTTVPLGSGFSSTTGTGPNGQSFNSTTVPLGGGFTSTTGTDLTGRSFNCTSVPLGGGFTSTSATDASGRRFAAGAPLLPHPISLILSRRLAAAGNVGDERHGCTSLADWAASAPRPGCHCPALPGRDDRSTPPTPPPSASLVDACTDSSW